MSKVLNNYVLVLNKHWQGIYVETIKNSLTKLCNGQARIVDKDNFIVYDWHDWIKLEVEENELYIPTSSMKIKVPKIIIASEYDKIPRKYVRLTRKNLLIRDGHRCAYSGIPLKPSTATIDHVNPRARGGKHNWENVVICDREINSKKGDKTLKEAGLKLRDGIELYRPLWNPLFAAYLVSIPKCWTSFLNKTQIEKHVSNIIND